MTKQKIYQVMIFAGNIEFKTYQKSKKEALKYAFDQMINDKYFLENKVTVEEVKA